MKTAVIFCENIKQIVFTPENESEKFALSLITADDDIELLLISGTIYDQGSPKPFTAEVCESRGGHLRIYKNSEESRILVLKPKEHKNI